MNELFLKNQSAWRHALTRVGLPVIFVIANFLVGESHLKAQITEWVRIETNPADTWEYGLIPLALTIVPPDAEGMIAIQWSGEAPPYQVQSRSSLGEGGWRDEGDPTNALGVVVPAAENTKFFRVLSLDGETQ